MQLQERKEKVILVDTINFYNTLRPEHINEKIIIFWFCKENLKTLQSTWPSFVISNLIVLTTVFHFNYPHFVQSQAQNLR